MNDYVPKGAICMLLKESKVLIKQILDKDMLSLEFVKQTIEGKIQIY
jgi:hypothetical protein